MKLRKVKTCLQIVLSVRLSSYKWIQNFAINATNFANATTDHAHRQMVKLMHKVLKYDLTETSLISNLDSSNSPVFNTISSYIHSKLFLTLSLLRCYNLQL